MTRPPFTIQRSNPDDDPEEPLFDLQKGRELRDEGASRALASAAVAEWKDKAAASLRGHRDSGREFTADDVTAEVGPPPEGHHNAMGGLFTTHRKDLERVGWASGKRKSRHAGLLTVWRGKKKESV